MATQIITVVGRAASEKEFAASIASSLEPGYKIDILFPVDGDGEMPNFLAVVSGEGEEAAKKVRMSLSDRLFLVEQHETPEETSAYIKENYGDEIKQNRPNLPAANTQLMYQAVVGFVAQGTTGVMEGKFDDEDVGVIVNVNETMEGAVVTPVALLLNSSLMSRLEIEGENEDE